MTRLVDAIFDRAWAMNEEGLKLVFAVASHDEFFADVRESALLARNGEPLKNTRDIEKHLGTAVIPVNGPLFRHASLMTDISGATSYQALRKDLQTAHDAQDVSDLVLAFDSPGGETNGMLELADAIYALRGKGKRVVAYIGGAGASAAFGLAAACDEVVVSPTAIVGSIGVIGSYRDEDDDKAITIVSSQSPNKNADPATDVGRALLQQRVDDLAQVFIERVATYRGMSAADIAKAGNHGGVLVGQKSVDAGLADRTGSLEGLIEELARTRTAKGPQMFQTKMAAAFGLGADATEEQLEQAAARAVAAERFQADACAAVGASSAEEARGKIVAGVEALRDIGAVRAQVAAAESESVKRDLRATLEQGIASKRLSLGAIQKTVPLFVADESKRTAMQEAFGKLEAVTAAGVIDAACSVGVSAAELRTIKAYAESSSPTTEPEKEPERKDEKDAEELDETARRIKAGADRARLAYDGPKKK